MDLTKFWKNLSEKGYIFYINRGRLGNLLTEISVLNYLFPKKKIILITFLDPIFLTNSNIIQINLLRTKLVRTLLILFLYILKTLRKLKLISFIFEGIHYLKK